MYQVFRAGMNDLSRPLGTLLFLGPTGSGKTRVVEAAAEILFGDAGAVINIDCAEFQHSHEISKLIGSPPGYLGHRETQPLLTQENLNKHYTERHPFALVLFDEVEKASDALWQLLLGVLDKATLRLGDNRRVDFSQTMIFMTSNIGTREISNLIEGSIGFAPAGSPELKSDELDQKIYQMTAESARRKFSPEFMNRIDKLVVFRRLNRDQLRQILDLELRALQRRICEGQEPHFTYTLTDEAKQFLLAQGTDYRYGARHLKRAIERFLVYPLAALVSTGQVLRGSVVVVQFDRQAEKLTFYRDEAGANNRSAARPIQKPAKTNNQGRVAA
jgi:ATP-dependent Clp protease ATP-binding subunit ClpA